MFTFKWPHKLIPITWTEIAILLKNNLQQTSLQSDLTPQKSSAIAAQKGRSSYIYYIYCLLWQIIQINLLISLGSKNCKQKYYRSDNDGESHQAFSQPVPRIYCYGSSPTYTVYRIPEICCRNCQATRWCFFMIWVVSSVWRLSPPLVGLKIFHIKIKLIEITPNKNWRNTLHSLNNKHQFFKHDASFHTWFHYIFE